MFYLRGGLEWIDLLHDSHHAILLMFMKDTQHKHTKWREWTSQSDAYQHVCICIFHLSCSSWTVSTGFHFLHLGLRVEFTCNLTAVLLQINIHHRYTSNICRCFFFRADALEALTWECSAASWLSWSCGVGRVTPCWWFRVFKRRLVGQRVTVQSINLKLIDKPPS